MSSTRGRLVTAAASLAVLGFGFHALVSGAAQETLPLVALLCPLAVGWAVTLRVPTHPVGPALAWCAGAVAVVSLAEAAAASAYTDDPWPAAELARPLWNGLWPLQLSGFLAVLWTFPDPGTPTRGASWRHLLPPLFTMACVGVAVANWGTRRQDGQVVGDGSFLLGLPALALLLTVLVLSVWLVVLRHRHGSSRERDQIRWLLLAGMAVVVLLALGWALETLGATLDVAYIPFLVAILVPVPLAVGFAIVRHDLFDVDRLLSDSTAWLLTLVVSSGIFATTVFLVTRAWTSASGVAPTAAAFVTALTLLPMHRHLAVAVARVVDPDRYRALVALQEFTADVRRGRRPPEDVEDALRSAQGDPDLRLYLRGDGDAWVTIQGQPAQPAAGHDLEAGGEVIARVTLGRTSARAKRRIGALISVAWVPIEVTRLRRGLQQALDEARSSRSRLADAAAVERRRLERDLHDGAQQHLLAIGMRLRLLQKRLGADDAAQLDLAVADIEAAVGELRGLAHGVRPARLDEGLDAALSALRDDVPLPFDLRVEELPPLSESRALTAYLVVTEAVTNAIKHARADTIAVCVAPDAQRIRITVRDDGIGGVDVATQLLALHDRVAACDGLLTVDSPSGRGTTLEVIL